MEELTHLLLTLFRNHSVEVDADSPEARSVIAVQLGLYDTLLRAARSIHYSQHSAAGSVGGLNEFAEAIFARCRELLTSSPHTEVRVSEKMSVIEGQIPILRDEDVHNLRAFLTAAPSGGRSVMEAKQFPYLIAAALVVETAEIIKAPLLDNISFNWPDFAQLQVQIGNYAAARREFRANAAGRRAVGSDIANLFALVENARAEFEKERGDQRVALDVLSASGLDIREKIGAAETELASFRGTLSSHETAIREDWKLNRARLNWNRRFKEARVGFRIACGLLAAYLVTTVAAAALWGPAIVASINHFDLALFISGGSVGTAIAHQLSRLFIFSVPILVYLWMLRVVMRFFMRSMLLMDDARQRETMLDTYLLLTEEDRADERDRPLILWALFRQTPGHGPDGVEPPDFTEVINAGFNRAKAAAGE